LPVGGYGFYFSFQIYPGRYWLPGTIPGGRWNFYNKVIVNFLHNMEVRNETNNKFNTYFDRNFGCRDHGLFSHHPVCNAINQAPAISDK
jgi:hypothetical protein